MPRPRFEKLSPEKREQILETAAQEFAAYGFENASLNRILEQAEVSKGAAYYYFDDKADLFITAVSYYAGSLVGNIEQSLSQLTAESFWPGLRALYLEQIAYSAEKPWILALFKSVNKLPPDTPAVNHFILQVQGWLKALVQRGQTLGVIRTDLPEDLLLGLFAAVDDAHDQWLLAHWHELNSEDIPGVVQRMVENLQRLLQP